MRKSEGMKKILSVLLTLSLVLSYVPVPALAEEVCSHHKHDAACGYVEAVEGRDCGHECTESCTMEAVTVCVHDHEAEGCIYTPAADAVPCDHEHGEECNYVPAQDEVLCTCGVEPAHTAECASVVTEGAECDCGMPVVHAEGCAPREAVAESCDHVEHEGCAYQAAVGESWSCGHICTAETDCIKQKCAHVCPEGDCGFVQKVVGQKCSFECDVCNASPVAEDVVDEALETVKAMVASLPAVDAAYAMTNQELGTWNNAIQSAYEAYCNLSDDQKAKLASEYEKLTGLLMALSNPSRTAPAEAGVVETGECGTGVTWTLLDDGTLTISKTGEGYGEITNYDAYDSPFDRSNRWERIKKVIIEDGITYVGNYLFYTTYPNLEYIQIPTSVKRILPMAFGGAYKCTTSKVRYQGTMAQWEQIGFFSDDDTEYGAVCSDGTILYHGSCGSNAKYRVLGNGTLEIYGSGTITNAKAQYTYSYWDADPDIKKVTISEGIENICGYAFKSCTNLTSISIPSTVTSIGYNAFYGCTSLEEITLPDAVTSIGNSAFANCSNLETITVPDGVTSLGRMAFQDCSKLKAVNIPAGIAIINELVFDGCSSLTSVTIPAGVTKIDKLAFQSCSGLKEVKLPAGLKSIELGAFAGCRELTEIELPDTVITIGEDAFSNCKKLEEIVIPAGVRNIYGLFDYCESLKSITFMGDCPTFQNYSFSGVENATVYYPENNDTWSSEVFKAYGGENIIWEARQADFVDYGIEIANISVTSENLSGEDWSYDSDSNILSLETHNWTGSLSVTRKDLTVQVDGDVAFYGLTAKDITLVGKTGKNADTLTIPGNYYIKTTGDLTVRNLYVRVPDIDNHEAIIVGESGTSATGCFTVDNANVYADSTGESKGVNCIITGSIQVLGHSYVYATTIMSECSSIRAYGSGSSFSSQCHIVGAGINPGSGGWKTEGITLPAQGYFYENGKYVLKTTTEGTTSGKHFIGVDHAEYVQTTDGTKHNLVCKCTSPTTLNYSEAHAWEYDQNSSDTILAECKKCDAEGSLKLLPPENLVSYNGIAREARLDGTIPGEENPVITYTGDVTEGKPVKAGTYTASITLGEKTATITFTVTGAVAEVTANGVTTPYAMLQAAVNAAATAENSIVKLLQDITLERSLEIASGKFTLDLNGKELRAGHVDTVKVSGGNLIITDNNMGEEKGSIKGGTMSSAVSVDDINAKVTLSGISIINYSLQFSYGVNVKKGDLSVSNCTITTTGPTYNYGIKMEDGNLAVADCTIDSGWAICFAGNEASITGNSIEADTGVMAKSGRLTLSDNKITAEIGMSIDGGVVNISDGEILGIGSTYNSGNSVGVWISGGTVNIAGGTISASKEEYGMGYGVYVEGGTVNITGGSITGSHFDIGKSDEATISLGQSADSTVGATFPGGIKTEDVLLKDILDDGVSFWIGDKEQPLAADTQEISGGEVVIKKHTQHSFVSFDTEKVTSDTHTAICGFCGKAVVEEHSFNEVAEKQYLKSVATHNAAAVYYKSCECGEKGTETFSYGKPLDHQFDLEEANEKYLKSAATHSAAAVYYKSCECGEKGTETFSYGKPLDHQFDLEAANEKYLKSAATHSAAAVYYKSCECGEKGTETFSYGKPLDHKFDLEAANEKYLKSAATHSAAAVYYKSCECGEKGTETFTYGAPLVGNVVILPAGELEGVSSVWIDGSQYPATADGEYVYIELPDGNASIMVTHSYYVGDASDVHTQYPTGMQVWRLTYDANGYTATRLEDFDNILQYSGSSIRVTGNKGIRMITSVEAAKKAALTADGLSGYKLVEYGTVLAQSSKMAGPLVLGESYAKSNYAYKRGVADPVFAYAGDLVQYTNVLVGFNSDQCKEDIAMRPYMILEDANGEQVTIYGGIVYRSIGYIAYQNRTVFAVGSAAYNYVWDIIHHVYGDKYDADYKG